MFQKRLETHSPRETQAVAQAIGARCTGGEVVLLVGTLGSGKTCFAQGLADGLGVTGYVHSPTFVLATEHAGRLRLRHVDLYRIDGPEETLDLGLAEFGADDLVGMVEWADRAPEAYPAEHLTVNLMDMGANRRSLTLNANGEHHEALIKTLDLVGSGKSV